DHAHSRAGRVPGAPPPPPKPPLPPPPCSRPPNRGDPMKLVPIFAVALLLGTACGHVPRPYTFDPPAPGDRALNLLASGLRADGHRISRIDRQRGEIVTYWEDTGYRFRETDDLEHETTIFLRYHVTVGSKDGGGRASLTADVQRCAADSAMII